MEEIILKIDEILEERGKSAYWLAKELNMDNSSLSRIRNQKTKGIQWKTLIPLCKALECTPGDLIVMVDSNPKTKAKSKK